jgi:hypothetical protein
MHRAPAHSFRMTVCTLDNETLYTYRKCRVRHRKCLGKWKSHLAPYLTLFAFDRISHKRCVPKWRRVNNTKQPTQRVRGGESPMIAVVATCNKLKQAHGGSQSAKRALQNNRRSTTTAPTRSARDGCLCFCFTARASFVPREYKRTYLQPAQSAC